MQLTLGVNRFDVREESPHPPGYWLYVMGGRALRWLTPLNAERSLQVLAALAAAVTVGLIYVVGRDMKNRWLGFSAAALMATCPYLLFYGTTPASYCFDALLCVALLLMVVRARPGSRHGLYAVVLLALGSGLRPSAALILAPLALWALAKSVRSIGQFAIAAAAGAIGLVAWAVPMLAMQPGGSKQYFEFSRVFFKPAFRSASLFYGASVDEARHNMAHATSYTIAAVSFLVPIAAIGILLYLVKRPDREAKRSTLALLVVAAVVPYAFLLFVYFGKAGYVLSLMPPIILLALWPAAAVPGRRLLASAAVVAMVLLQLQRFLFAPGILPLRFINHERIFFTRDRYGAPFGLTHKVQDQIDRETDQYRAIAQEFDPAKDVVAYAWLDGAHRFRHGCFTLPQFRVHYVIGESDHFLCKHGRMLSESDKDIEVPSPDSRVIWTLDVPTDETKSLLAQGKLQVHVLKTGRTVYITQPGTTLFGVTPTVTADHPLATHNP